jgi:hypothetical protein
VLDANDFPRKRYLAAGGRAIWTVRAKPCREGGMETKPPRSAAGKAGDDRADRLKAALKANIARRKAQARARGETGAHRAEDEAAGQGRKG